MDHASHLHDPAHTQDPRHEHCDGHHDHRAASRKALIGALFLLSFIFVVELAGGLISGSLALLADAGHLLTDVAAVALALLAQWFATRPACAQKSYGFQRVEILAALINGVTLWGISGYIIYEAVKRMGQPPEIASGTMVIIAAIGLAVQTVAAIMLARAKGESLNVKGAYIHAATDAVQSGAVVVVGVTMMLTGWWILDPIVSVLIALLIAWSGGRIVWEATHVLLEGTPEGLDLVTIAKHMQAVPGVVRVADLHAWSITTGYNALSAHVLSNPELTAEQREALRESLSREMTTVFALHHVTLQVETRCRLSETHNCSEWLGDAVRES